MKDEWQILDPADNEIGIIAEDSWLLATIRRWAANFIPQKFHGTVRGRPVLTFQQGWNPFVLKISLDFTPDVEGQLDRRMGLAAAILICGIEGRQD